MNCGNIIDIFALLSLANTSIFNSTVYSLMLYHMLLLHMRFASSQLILYCGTVLHIGAKLPRQIPSETIVLDEREQFLWAYNLLHRHCSQC